MANTPVTAASERPPPRNDWEAYVANSEILAGAFKYVSDEEFNDKLRRMGYTEDESAGIRKSMNDNINKTMRESPGVIIRGLKPNKDATDVLVYHIPGSPLSIRIWDGGMVSDGHYLLDIFDCATGKAVNSPKDFEFVPIYRPGVLPVPLVSWEVIMGCPRDGIREGEERFSVAEGSRWTLKWRGGHFSFAIPVRMDPTLALPIPYVPCIQE